MEPKEANNDAQKRSLLDLMKKLAEIQTNNMMLTAKIATKEGKEQVKSKVNSAKEKITNGAQRYGQKMEKIQEQYNLNKEEKGNILFEYEESLDEINKEYNERIKLALEEKQDLEAEEQNLMLEEVDLKDQMEEEKKSPEYLNFKEEMDNRIIDIKSDLDKGNLDDVGIKNEELKQLKKTNPLLKYEDAIEAVRNQRHEICDLIEKCEQEIEAYNNARTEHIDQVAEDKDNKLATIQKQSFIQKMAGALFNKMNGAKKFKDNVMDVFSKKVDKIKNEDLPKIKEDAAEKKNKFVDNMKDKKDKISEKASIGKEALKGKAETAKNKVVSTKDRVVNVSKQSFANLLVKGKNVKSGIADKFETKINDKIQKNEELKQQYQGKEESDKDSEQR